MTLLEIRYAFQKNYRALQGTCLYLIQRAVAVYLALMTKMKFGVNYYKTFKTKLSDECCNFFLYSFVEVVLERCLWFLSIIWLRVKSKETGGKHPYLNMTARIF